MRKVYVKLYVETILRMDEGVELDQFLAESDLQLKSDDTRVDVEQVAIMHHEVTDSK